MDEKDAGERHGLMKITNPDEPDAEPEYVRIVTAPREERPLEYETIEIIPAEKREPKYIELVIEKPEPQAPRVVELQVFGPEDERPPVPQAIPRKPAWEGIETALTPAQRSRRHWKKTSNGPHSDALDILLRSQVED